MGHIVLRLCSESKELLFSVGVGGSVILMYQLLKRCITYKETPCTIIYGLSSWRDYGDEVREIRRIALVYN